jgi:hypothetical protein
MSEVYRAPVLFPTITDIGVALVDEIPAPVGDAVAVSVTAPLVEGRHEHVAEKLDPLPLATLFLHPAIITFFALKLTLDATLTFAVIVTTVRKVGVPLKENELKAEVSTTSVTVIVIVCVPALLAKSVAVKTKS